MLLADDNALCSTRRGKVENKLEVWRRAMEETKQYVTFNGGDNTDSNLRRENFVVAGLHSSRIDVGRDGDLDVEITHGVQSGWRLGCGDSSRSTVRMETWMWR